MPLGIGIIGIGRHADRYLAPAVRAAADAELVAVYSRARERAEGFAARQGTPRPYDDLDAFLADPRVEAVIVATPNGTHAEYTIRAARAGKHVLCEKAMATSVADAEAMVAASREAGVTLGIAFHLRHHPAHQETRRLRVARAIGNPLLAKVQYAVAGPPPSRDAPPPRPEALALSGGGIATGIGIHLIDLLRFVTGREVEEVTAFCEGRPAEFHASALLRMRGGVVAHLDCGRGLARPLNEVILHGTEGTIVERGAVVGGHSGLFIEATVEYSNLWGNAATEHSAQRVYVNEVEDFVQAIREGRAPLASGEDGVQAQRVLAALYESADTGRAVRVAGER